MFAVCVHSSIPRGPNHPHNVPCGPNHPHNVPCGPNHPHNVEKRDKLRRDKAVSQKMPRANLKFAISKCVSDESRSNHVKDRCNLVLNDIEEQSAHIHDIDDNLAKYWEYLDEIECTFYDV